MILRMEGLFLLAMMTLDRKTYSFLLIQSGMNQTLVGL